MDIKITKNTPTITKDRHGLWTTTPKDEPPPPSCCVQNEWCAECALHNAVP